MHVIAEEFEAERDELLRAVARCAVQADELHRLEWENRKRADEVRELQQVRFNVCSRLLAVQSLQVWALLNTSELLPPTPQALSGAQQFLL